MADNDLSIFQNIGLSDIDTSGQTSTVGEPSVANNGREIFVTGNWYATRSLDNGGSWEFLSPYNTLPSVDGGFCCDQTVLYDPSRNLLFWLLQYVKQNNTNTLRVAVKSGSAAGNNNWYWWDFQPTSVNAAWSNEWFDYNHAALSNNYLYVGSNVFRTTDDIWTRSVVLRLPLDALANGTALNYNYFQSTENFSLRCVQGARDVMYFSSHNNQRQIRLFSWPENNPRVSQQDVNISRWNDGQYSAPSSDGKNWLGRCDGRMTGGWVGNGTIGFAWSANRIDTSRPLPYVKVVRLNEQSKAVIDEPDIWNPNFGYAYPDISPNDRGDVGISLFRGGGSFFPSHVIGVWDDASRQWKLQIAKSGTNSPTDGKWGDYLGCRRHAPNGLTWLAAGYTLQGGGDRSNIEPRVVHFGFERDRGAALRWQNA